MAHRREPAGVTSIERDVQRSLADRAIAPYFREPALWPVAIVLVAHGVLGIGVALLEALRNGMGFGLVALVLVGCATAWAVVHDARRRRLGATCITLVTCWTLGALSAWAADHYGLY
jgi:hypothetical protein